MTPTAAARFLMCAPTFFDVAYVINPWMREQEHHVDSERAKAQWHDLHALLTDTLDAHVDLIAPLPPGLPDIVFTANAGLARDKICVLSRFRYTQRRNEEPVFRAWFEAHGFAVHALPKNIAFEGAGDALFDEHEPSRLWAAHGVRTDAAAHPHLSRLFDVDVVTLGLEDTRFYHLDTCFCPLPGGFLLWFPAAFDAPSRARIESLVPPGRRAAVCADDALRFACNAVSLGNVVILNACSDTLSAWLSERGFRVYATPLTEFIRAGGSAKCLILRVG